MVCTFTARPSSGKSFSTKGARGREAEVEELYNAVVHNRPVFHDGRWGAATLEVCLAMLESAEKRKEIFLSHQVPSPE